MSIPSQSEQRYIKAIYQLTERDQDRATTTELTHILGVSAPSVSDMITKLQAKKLVIHQKYYGVYLSTEGRHVATQLIRKQRIWESFLAQKLKYRWDEIQSKAAELASITDSDIIRRLDILLDQPKWSPLGDPIPNAAGKFSIRTQLPLADLGKGYVGELVAVKQAAPDFLQYLSSIHLVMGARVKVLERIDYDQSMQVVINGDHLAVLSNITCQQLFIKRL